MHKDLQSLLPKSFEVGPVEVILGGIDNPKKTSGVSNIEFHSSKEEPMAPPDIGIADGPSRRRKTIDDVLPKSYDCGEQVYVTFVGIDESLEDNVTKAVSPPTKEEYLASADTCCSGEENVYLKPLDEILPHYHPSSESCYSIAFSEDAIIKPLEEITIQTIPRQKEPMNPDKMSKKQFLDKVWDNDSDDGDVVDCQLSPTIMEAISSIQPKNKGLLTEDDLQCILTEKYLFGVYGQSLYVRDHNYVYSAVTAQTVRRLLMETLTKDQRKRFKIRFSKDVLERLLSAPEVRNNPLAFPRDKVLFTNGAYNIITQLPAEIEDHDFFTTCINANFVPGTKLSSPFFDRYLESTSGGDKTIKRRICAMLGYLMLLGYPGKKILVLGTARDSGKSAIIRFYQRLVGPELVCGQSPFDMTVNHALSEFAGKITNAPMDIPATYIKPYSVGVMKAVSGGDLVSMNPKGKDRQSVFCYTKQILGTNSPLHLQQFDAAFWERVVVIPYIHSISPEQRIPDIEDRFWEERDAIVTKCMKAAKKLLEANYEFPDCAVAEKMKDDWIGWRSHAKEYLLSHCVAEEGRFTPSTPLYDAYLDYCTEHSVPYGTFTAFIRLAKNLFGIPLDEPARAMINGVQMRGLPCVRYLGEFK